MRVPVSWLREYAPIPQPYDALEVGRRLTLAGLEVEAVEQAGHDVHGVITAQVMAIEELTGFKKPIRYCRVAVSDAELAADPEALTGVICGAVNFREGDRVAFAVVGAMLPGGFEITAAKKYGRASEGMICAVDELGIGDDHAGILVLPPDTPLGVDFVDYAGLRDDVLEITVTPDRGYAVSVRGVARELASAYQVPFTDPARTFVPGEDASGIDATAADEDAGTGDAATGNARPWPAEIEDPTACDRFVLREVRGFDPGARTPLWMTVRLARCGVRSVSLAVDVTNYLMIELGQPLHAFDRAKLHGTVIVRRARPGETLTTLDHVTRTLHPDDILITDDTGPISMAGTMGGLATEIDDDSTDIVIEGAHFSDTGTAKMSRRHRLHSEASYRFERGTDRELPPRATARAAALLASLGGATIVPGETHAQVPVTPVTISLAADYPDRVAGVVYGMDTVVARLQEVGCEVRSAPASQAPTIAPWRAGPPEPTASGDHDHDHGGRHDRQLMVLLVTPPSWRPDLTDPADLAEEVIRLEGYGNVPVRQPRAAAGQGLSERQKALRATARALGAAGFVEVHSDPFAPADEADRLMLAPEDPRRPAVKVANPLSEDQPQLRTTLLPGLFRTLVRNVGRGFPDTALFETGQVFLPRPGSPGIAPILATDQGPAEAEARDARRRAARPAAARGRSVLAGNGELPGWWGPGRAADWADAIEAARSVGAVSHLALNVRAAAEAPWHPGRCAALYVRSASGGEWLAGHMPASCTRGCSRPTACRRGPARSSSTSPCCRRPPRRPSRCTAPRCPRTRSLPRTWRSWWRRRCPPPRWRPPCGTERASCSRTCGCSMSTPARQLAEGRKSLAYTLRSCARRTARSRPRRRTRRPRRRAVSEGHPAHRRGAPRLSGQAPRSART